MYRIPFPTQTRDQNTEMALLMHTATLSQVVWIQGHGSSYQLQHEKLSQSLVAKTAKIILLSLVIIQEGLLWLMLAPRRSGGYSHVMAGGQPGTSILSRIQASPCGLSPGVPLPFLTAQRPQVILSVYPEAQCSERWFQWSTHKELHLLWLGIGSPIMSQQPKPWAHPDSRDGNVGPTSQCHTARRPREGEVMLWPPLEHTVLWRHQEGAGPKTALPQANHGTNPPPLIFHHSLFLHR